MLTCLNLQLTLPRTALRLGAPLTCPARDAVPSTLLARSDSSPRQKTYRPAKRRPTAEDWVSSIPCLQQPADGVKAVPWLADDPSGICAALDVQNCPRLSNRAGPRHSNTLTNAGRHRLAHSCHPSRGAQRRAYLAPPRRPCRHAPFLRRKGKQTHSKAKKRTLPL